MKRLSLLCAACLFVIPLAAQPPLDMKELLRILKIQTWRIRVPSDARYVWDIKPLRKQELHVAGMRPRGLTVSAKYLLAFREIDDNKFEFTLPELKGFSQGNESFCELGADCKGHYSVQWRPTPTYSADGEQCVLGELSNLEDASKIFIALVRMKSTLD